jgi:hypothetical protein
MLQCRMRGFEGLGATPPPVFPGLASVTHAMNERAARVMKKAGSELIYHPRYK